MTKIERRLENIGNSNDAKNHATFGRSFISVLGGNVVVALFAAAAVLITIRSLPPELWAASAIITGLGPLIAQVISFGSVPHMVRELSRQTLPRLRRETYSRFFYRRSVLAALLAIFGAAAFAIPHPSSAAITAVLWLACARFVRSGTSVLMASEKRFTLVSSLAVLEKVICLLYVAVVAWLGMASSLTLPIGYIVSSMVGSVAALAVEKPSAIAQVGWKAVWRPWAMWRGSGAFGVANIAAPLQQADVLIMATVGGQFQAGLLAAGSRLPGATNVIGAALVSVVMPYYAISPDESPKFTRRKVALVAFLGLGVLMTVSVAITAKVWVPVVLGTAYLNASMVVGCYVLLSLLLTAIYPMIAVLQAWDHEVSAMRISLLQSLGGLGAIAGFGAMWGANGAALGMLLINSAVLVLLGLYLRRIKQASTHGRNPISESDDGHAAMLRK